ncbi:MAG TPA: HAMP domain-containing sensor histidine kinase [Nocardioidaceae bacterium]|nr:HAMP domain-containing sensor histidine kinase [Nocardioidaceae bacterium]
MLVLVIALLFVLLFARALTSFLRDREPLAGEVALLFGAYAGIFVTSVSRVVFGGDPSEPIRAVSSALLLVVPLLTLRLVSRFRGLPVWVMPAALVLYLVTAVPVVLMTGPDELPSWLGLLALAAFVVTELVAAAYFAAEARDRVGAARLRLQVATAATALVAVTLLSTLLDSPPVPQGLALVSALGYIAAFMPRRRLLSASTMAAAHRYGRELLTGPSQPTPEQVWARFAGAVRELTESDGVAVLTRTSHGETGLLAAAGLELRGDQVRERVEFEQMNRLSHQRKVNRDCPIESMLAARVGARYVTLVPLLPPYPEMPAHVAMLFSMHRSLFSGDDLVVIRDLGAQAALLAGRAEAAYEQRRLTTELRETVDALHVASQAKSDLLARVSHEFRTPLTAIIGYSALLRRSGDGGDPGDPMLTHTGPDRIHSAGLHLLALVEEVLDLAQMDAGHFDLQVEDVDLSSLAARTAEELRPLATRKRQMLLTDVPEGVLRVDPNRMRQVLYNLLSNAIKYTPAGGTISVTALLEDDKARITVADDGIGIPLDDQRRIFEEFTQVAEHGPHEGTGLGLSIVRRLVAAHGGHTELESAPGEGSRFIVTLPREAHPQAPAPMSAAEPSGGVGRQ